MGHKKKPNHIQSGSRCHPLRTCLGPSTEAVTTMQGVPCPFGAEVHPDFLPALERPIWLKICAHGPGKTGLHATPEVAMFASGALSQWHHKRAPHLSRLPQHVLIA